MGTKTKKTSERRRVKPRSSPPTGSAWARIFVSVDGAPEEIKDAVEIPRDAIPDALEYLKKRTMLPAGPLLRIFVANWRAGHNLNLPNNKEEATSDE